MMYLLDVSSEILETSIEQFLLPIRNFTKSVNLTNTLL